MTKLIYILLATMLTSAAFAQAKPHRKPAPRPPAVPRVGGETSDEPNPPAPVRTATAAAQQPQPIVTYEQLEKAGVAYARQCALTNEKTFHLGRFQNGGFRNESEHLLTKNDSTNAELKIKYIDLGFYFPDKKEWSWIWWNNNAAAEPLKTYGKAHKMSQLTTEFLTLENTVDAVKLAQAAAYILKAKGVEAIPSPDGSHFWFVAYEYISQ